MEKSPSGGIGVTVLAMAFVVTLSAIVGLALWASSGGDALANMLVVLVILLVIMLCGMRKWRRNG